MSNKLIINENANNSLILDGTGNNVLKIIAPPTVQLPDPLIMTTGNWTIYQDYIKIRVQNNNTDNIENVITQVRISSPSSFETSWTSAQENPINSNSVNNIYHTFFNLDPNTNYTFQARNIKIGFIASNAHSRSGSTIPQILLPEPSFQLQENWDIGPDYITIKASNNYSIGAEESTINTEIRMTNPITTNWVICDTNGSNNSNNTNIQHTYFNLDIQQAHTFELRNSNPNYITSSSDSISYLPPNMIVLTFLLNGEFFSEMFVESGTFLDNVDMPTPITYPALTATEWSPSTGIVIENTTINAYYIGESTRIFEGTDNEAIQFTGGWEEGYTLGTYTYNKYPTYKRLTASKSSFFSLNGNVVSKTGQFMNLEHANTIRIAMRSVGDRNPSNSIFVFTMENYWLGGGGVGSSDHSKKWAANEISTVYTIESLYVGHITNPTYLAVQLRAASLSSSETLDIDWIEASHLSYTLPRPHIFTSAHEITSDSITIRVDNLYNNGSQVGDVTTQVRLGTGAWVTADTNPTNNGSSTGIYHTFSNLEPDTFYSFTARNTGGYGLANSLTSVSRTFTTETETTGIPIVTTMELEIKRVGNNWVLDLNGLNQDAHDARSMYQNEIMLIVQRRHTSNIDHNQKIWSNRDRWTKVNKFKGGTGVDGFFNITSLAENDHSNITSTDLNNWINNVLIDGGYISQRRAGSNGVHGFYLDNGYWYDRFKFELRISSSFVVSSNLITAQYHYSSYNSNPSISYTTSGNDFIVNLD